MPDRPFHPGSSAIDRQHELVRAARGQAEACWARAGSSDLPHRTGFTLPADAIPAYELTREIHRGGQGIVYEAVHARTRRRVAIKVMREGPFAGPRDRARFDREIHVLAQLDHPGIVAVHDNGQAAGCEYFVMDYVAGLPLDQYVRTELGPLTDRKRLRQLLEMFAAMCDGVNAAHLRGVIHRDLKPGNIRVDPRGQPRILDFGLAKVYEIGVEAELGSGQRARTPALPMTDPGHFVGTLAWASPEQIQATADALDVRTDVYSLGLILHFLLTGQMPYAVDTAMPGVVAGILYAEPQRPSRLSPVLDDELDTIVLKCLQKDRERRYQSAGELARDVRHYLAGEPIEAKRDSAVYVIRKHLRRHRAAVLVSVGGLALLVAGLLTSLTFWQRAEVQREAADERRIHAEAVTELLEQMLLPADPHHVRDGRHTARQLLDEFAAGLKGSSGIPPTVESAVRTVIGKAYLGLGQHDRAREQLDAALALSDASDSSARADTLTAHAWLQHDLGNFATAENEFQQAADVAFDANDTIRRAEALSGLADLHRHRGTFAKGQSAAKQSLDLLRGHLGPNHPRVAQALQTLALLLRTGGDAAAAEPLLIEALTILRGEFGNEHPRVAMAIGDLAAIRNEQGAFDEAERLLAEALAIYRGTLGPEHPEVAAIVNNLGSVQHRQGRLDHADRTLRQALELRRRLHGDDHRDVGVTLGNLAVLAKDRGDLGEAETFGRDAVRIARLHGDAHPDLATTLSNLARILLARDDLAGAEPVFREALDLARRIYGDGHAEVATVSNNLAMLRFAQGDYAAAEPLFQQSLAIYRGLYGDQHPNVSACLSNLGKVRQALGDLAGAETHLREALGINRAALGIEHPELANNLANLAALLCDRADFGQAEQLMRECLTIRRAALPDGHWLIGNAEYRLGACLMELEQTQDSEELLLAGHTTLTAAPQAPPWALAESMELLARFYERTGQPDRADEFRTKLTILQGTDAPR